ncbi:MBL fold metallo-hydrolase [Agaribacterium sp. ZY112]|uniref:MBL fold metallo-hydrolase n=1 Tax=Agaribacterium sp. ZY112 TaxID=3233574 RepID=UPI0035266EA2
MALKYCTVSVTHYQQNCSIAWCENTRQAAVIDPGGDVSRLLNKIKDLGVELKQVLLTHGHMDHVGGAAQIAAELDLPIIGPAIEDKFWMDALDGQASMMGFEAQPPLVPTRWLKDGEAISIGECELSVIHCPGHTPGHVVFYSADAQRAFVGDVLFAGSIGRTDFPQGDLTTLLNSIRNKLFVLGDDIAFVPGHGPESNFGAERQTNPFVADHSFG